MHNTVTKNKLLITSMVLLLMTSLLYSQDTEEEFYQSLGYTENVKKKERQQQLFWKLVLGPGAQAMGGAFTAVADDISAMYWNPAGITQLNGFALTANHSGWLANTNLEYFGVVLPMGSMFTMGVNITYLDYIDSQPVRTIELPEGTGEFYSASDLAMAATMAMKVTDRFSFGLNAKYIRQEIWNETANAMALDFGVLYHSSLKGLTIGTSISNFGTDLQLSGRDLIQPFDADELNYSNDQLNVYLDTGTFPLPLLFRFGLAYKLDIGQYQSLTFSSDLNHPSNNVESMNLGIEYCLMSYLRFQAGYESLFDDESICGLSYGLGLNIPVQGVMYLDFNYAYADWGILGDVQRYSIEIGQ